MCIRDRCDGGNNKARASLATIANGQKDRHSSGQTSKSGYGTLEHGHARSPIRFRVTWLTKLTTPTRRAAMQAAEISADQIWMV